jgi:hypothetical protein
VLSCIEVYFADTSEQPVCYAERLFLLQHLLLLEHVICDLRVSYIPN